MGLAISQERSRNFHYCLESGKVTGPRPSECTVAEHRVHSSWSKQEGVYLGTAGSRWNHQKGWRSRFSAEPLGTAPGLQLAGLGLQREAASASQACLCCRQGVAMRLHSQKPATRWAPKIYACTPPVSSADFQTKVSCRCI